MTAPVAAQFAVAVENPPETPGPPPGDAEITWSYAGIQTAVPIVIELPAKTVSIERVGSGPLDPRGAATVRVQHVLNDYGGYEPRTGAFSVSVPALPSFTSDVVITPDADKGGATLTLRTAPTVPLDLHVTAAHTNPAAGSYTTSNEIVIPVNRAPPNCYIVPVASSVGTGGRLALEIQQSYGESAPAEFLGASWSPSVNVAPVDATHAVFNAPSAEGSVQVTAELQYAPGVGPGPNAYCGDKTRLDAFVEVRRDVDVSLSFDRTRVAPGGVMHAIVHVRPLVETGVQELVLELDLDRGLKPLSRTPTVSAGVTVHPEGLVGRTSAALGIAGAPPPTGNTRANRFVVDVTGSEEQVLDFALLARPGFACGVARGKLSASRNELLLEGSDDADNNAKVSIECDPELNEATLVGRVFDDHNGNGEQEEGEQGIPGVMVATSTGIWATTDTSGSYHMVRLAPGRHVVKVNPMTLPLGARVRDGRREVTLTPGGFLRVSFGVQMPELGLAEPLGLIPEGSGVAIAEGVPVYRARFRLPVAGRMQARRDAIVVEGTLADGVTTVSLPLDGGDYWTLTLRAEDGRTWLWSFAVHAYAQAAGGRLVIPWGPRALGGLTLPAEAIAGERLALAARLSPGVEVRAKGVGLSRSCTLNGSSSGDARCELPLSGTEGQLALSVDAPADAVGDDPPPATVTVPWHTANAHFLVGRAGGEVSLVVPTPKQAEKGEWDAGGAFFYSGLLGGRWHVTGGADLEARDLLYGELGERRSWQGSLGRLFGHDPRRSFRDLDPEAFYPTYGDASVSVDEREAGGRLYLRLQRDRSYLKWGGINTAITDAEVGQYVRSLYGLGSSVDLDDGGTWGARATLFGAKPDSSAARDELLLTGGTLYFLAHRDVVEGSLRVTMELLDEISGVPIRVLPLVEGVDYEADYLGGRVSLDAALPARAFGQSITAADSGGHVGRLIVDYEYFAGSDPLHDWTVGARAVGRVGAVSLGATAVGEYAGTKTTLGHPRYSLAGATARADFGELLRARAELAHSEGQSHTASRSLDGGLSFEPLTSGAPQGEAAALELSSRLGAVTSVAYGRWNDAGFTDSRTAPGRRLRQAGLKLDADFETRTRFYGQADLREERRLPAALVRRNLGLVGLSQALGPVTLGVEGRYEAVPTEDASRTLLGARLGWRPLATLELSLRRRQVFGAPTTGLLAQGSVSGTAAGAAYVDPGALTLGVEAGLTDHGRPFGRVQGSLPVADDTDLYAAFIAASPLASDLDVLTSERGDHFVLGGRERTTSGASLYAEQSFRMDGAERQLTRSVGVETSVAPGLALGIAYERGLVTRELADAEAVTGPGHVQRDAGSVGVVYQGARLGARLGVDARFDDGAEPGEIMQLGGQGRITLFVTRGLTLAGGARGGSTYTLDSDGPRLTRDAWEGSAGFALRPLDGERMSVFGRYALTHERGAEPTPSTPSSQLEAVAAGPRVVSISHVVAVAVLVHPAARFDLGPKLYYRDTRVSLGADAAHDVAVLGALRGDLHVTGTWDASAEGRACGAPKSGEPVRYGALLEASALALEWLRLGAGYNLSQISAAGVRCQEPGARGFFVRAEAVY